MHRLPLHLIPKALCRIGDLPDRSMHAPHPDHIIDLFLESNDDEY
jgi:hypothetical protein